MDSEITITSQHRSFEIRTEYLPHEKHTATRVNHLRTRPCYIVKRTVGRMRCEAKGKDLSPLTGSDARGRDVT